MCQRERVCVRFREREREIDIARERMCVRERERERESGQTRVS